MNVRRRRRAVVAVLSIALAAGLAACGDDSENADIGDACDAHASVLAGFNTLFTTLPAPPDDGPPPSEYATALRSSYDANIAVPLASLVANAPDEIRDETEEVARKVRQFRDEADSSVIEGEDFERLTGTVDGYLFENCSGTKASVEATNYAYDGLPPTLPAGTVRFELENTSDEAHEMVVVRRKPGVTETYDQLLALPGDQLRAKVDFVDTTSANPDETTFMVPALPVGDYLVVCTYGKGTTDDDEPTDDEPHFQLGMKQEVKVA